jgi:replicative DNA helicase
MQEPVYPSTPLENTPEFRKSPPFSIEAEQSVLGGLMLDNATWFLIAELLSEKDFYRPEHQILFQTLKSLFEEGQPVDAVTVSERLLKHNNLDAIGGLPYIEQLYRNTPSAANIGAYAEIVRERSILRRLMRVGNEITQSAFNPQGRKSTDLLDNAERLVFEIAEQGARQRGGFIAIKELLTATLDRIDALSQQEGSITGMATGFSDFDELTTGLQRSDLIIIAGRPSMGKCITSDAKIALADGSVTTIEEICRRQYAQLFTLGTDWQFHLTQPTAFLNNGWQPVYRVTTRLGRDIETTLTHPFLTFAKGWQPLSEISVGEKIAVPSQLEIFGTTTLPECEVKLLGYWLGKENLRKEKPQFFQLSPLIKNDFLKALLQFDDQPSTADFMDIRIRRASYRDFLDFEDTIVIPPIIFTLPRPQVALFLNRHFAVSGKTQITATGIPSIGYSSMSETLTKGIQHLLLRFGILAILTRSKTRPPIWRLTINDMPSLQTFINEIGIFSKEMSLSQLREALSPRLPAKASSPISFIPHTSHIYWDTIIAIEHQGSKEVYDLTIADTHNFVANDVCVHNTSFAMNIAEHVVIEKKRPVAVFSMEMSSEQLMMRLLSSTARVDLQKVRTGKNFNDDDWEKITKALTKLNEAPLFIDDTPALNPTELRARIRRLAREQGQLGLVVIDYLQLMQVPDTKENRATEVSEISRSLKALAKELNVPIVALSQLNRSLEQRPDKRPRMSDLRESGSIEQDSDLIVFIYRDEVYNEDSPDKGTAEIIIAKQRNGPIGKVRLAFLGNFTMFGNYTPDSYYNG